MLQASTVEPQFTEALDDGMVVRHVMASHRSGDAGFESPRRMIVASVSGRSGALPILELLRLHGHCANCVLATSCQQLIAAVHRCEAKLLLLDLEMVKVTAMEELLDLRRQLPKVLWILGSRAAAPPCADLAVQFQARGCINLEAPDTIVRAIETVLAGDLWFPRWMTDDLYKKLLTEHHTNSRRGYPAGTRAEIALTHREEEAMDLVADGLTNKQIARQLGVSVNTVKKHLKSAFEKRGLHSRRQAAC